MNFTKNIGFLLLAIWLILTGLSAFISMGGLGAILALLAIAAGVFILLGASSNVTRLDFNPGDINNVHKKISLFELIVLSALLLLKSMPEINNPPPASGTLPDNYQEVLYWTIAGKPMRVIAMNVLGVFLFVTFGFIFSWLAFSLGKLPLEGEIRILSLSTIGLVLAGVLLTLGLHELTHGLAMQMFGAKPKYGIIWQGMLYATSPGYAYHRNNYVVTALAPFVFLSILFVLGMWLLQGTLWVALLGICGIFNAAGAIGDMWITMIVLRYPATAYVMDERDGMRVFSLAPPARAGVPKP